MLDDIAAVAGQLCGMRSERLELPGSIIDLAARLSHLPGTVALISGGDLDCARHHIIGALPWLTLLARGDRTEIGANGKTRVLEGDPLEAVRAVIRQLRLPPGDWPGPLSAGLLGYLAYDLKDRIEDLPRTTIDDLGLPGLLLYAPSVIVVHDRHRGETRLCLPLRKGASPGGEEILTRFKSLIEAPLPDLSFKAGRQALLSNFTRKAYEAAIDRIIDYIAAGDVYQVNMSQRFRTDFSGSAFGLFRRLYRMNPAPFFAFVQAGDHQVVSTSPERFLLRDGSRVESRPIKGTRPRGRTAGEDNALREELAGSAKDDAELSMIVDLMRNDIGKVCKAGSVRVAEHKRIEAYQNVYHLISIVTGELDAKKDSLDLIAATFPGGSITGCPKVRSMEIIDELETHSRHAYTGSIGYISFHDTMDLSIAIRTAVVLNDTMVFSVGGGIVFDSKPAAEYEETLHKGRSLMAAASSRDPIAGPGAVCWQNGVMLPAGQARVAAADLGLQYGYGFFETIRADAARAPLLAYHTSRINRTWRALMPGAPPDLSWDEIIARVVQANGLENQCAAVKILITRGTRNQPPWDHTFLVTARPYTHRLAGKSVAGLHLGRYPEPRQTPLAGHKTLNYLFYYLAGQWAGEHGFDEALVLNPDHTVSETNTANLLVIKNKEVVRPSSPAVLPGVMAEAAGQWMAGKDYHMSEQALTTEALLSADQVLACNALMGAVPVVGIDGRRRPAGGDLWERINDALLGAAWRR